MTWLILDMDYLANRALHSTGGLRYDGEPTGVTFGILRDIQTFAERFQTDQFVFCFDHTMCLRTEILPTYKETRRKRKFTIEEEEAKVCMRSQLERLRVETLNRLGFGNILHKLGYEADDHMAATCLGLPVGGTAIIVTADEDLLQMLSSNVSVYHPAKKELVTAEWFEETYHIEPTTWPRVKALAGCGTDDVPGVPGVAELTAVKYLRGLLSHRHVAYQRCLAFESGDYQRNLQLVRLPFAGLKPYTPAIDITPRCQKEWNRLCSKMGMDSLVVKERGGVDIEWGGNRAQKQG